MLANYIDFISDPNDPALRRIAILGIESKDHAASIAAIGTWLRKNLPDVDLVTFRISILETRLTERNKKV